MGEAFSLEKKKEKNRRYERCYKNTANYTTTNELVASQRWIGTNIASAAARGNGKTFWKLSVFPVRINFHIRVSLP